MNKKSESGFISHLTELRQRLINSLIFLTFLFVICYYFSENQDSNNQDSSNQDSNNQDSSNQESNKD